MNDSIAAVLITVVALSPGTTPPSDGEDSVPGSHRHVHSSHNMNQSGVLMLA